VGRVGFFVALIGMLLWSCNKGLSPELAQPAGEITGIEGTIYYQNWPPPDSLFDLRLVVFQHYPPGNILLELLGQQAFAYPPITDSLGLPLYVDSTHFQMELPPGVYRYVVVAWRFGPTLYQDWAAAGHLDVDRDLIPDSIAVLPGQLVRGIKILVDFKNRPPSPF